MNNFLEILTQITFVFFIISSTLFGFSQAVNIYIQRTLMSIEKESDRHYNKLSIPEKKECDAIIDDCLKQYIVFSQESKEFNKVKKNNRIRKFFKLKEKDLVKPTISFKDIIISLASKLSICFLPINQEVDNGNNNTMFLSFSEREIFELSTSLIKRIDGILSTKDLKVLKRIKLSNLLVFLDYYGKYSEIKNNLFFVICLDVINIALFISKFFSPIGSLKTIVKNISNDEFKDLLSNTIIKVIGKELSVLYKERATIRGINEDNNN